MLGTREVAERFGVTPAAVRRWCREGYLPEATLVGIGRRATWQIPESALDGFEPPKTGRPKESGDK